MKSCTVVIFIFLLMLTGSSPKDPVEWYPGNWFVQISEAETLAYKAIIGPDDTTEPYMFLRLADDGPLQVGLDLVEEFIEGEVNPSIVTFMESGAEFAIDWTARGNLLFMDLPEDFLFHIVESRVSVETSRGTWYVALTGIYKVLRDLGFLLPGVK